MRQPNHVALIRELATSPHCVSPLHLGALPATVETLRDGGARPRLRRESSPRQLDLFPDQAPRPARPAPPRRGIIALGDPRRPRNRNGETQ